MKTGFPSHLSIADLFHKFKSDPAYLKFTSTDQKDFSNKLLRSCGLRWKDFKLGNTKIFFRKTKFDILSEKLKEDSQTIINRLYKLKLLRRRWHVAIIVARFCCKKNSNLLQISV